MLEYRHLAVAALTLALSSAVFPTLSPALSSASASAESGAFSRFIDGIVSSKVSFDYSYVLDNGKVKITGEGNVVFQGDSFVMKGDGLEVYCDGTDKWTVDRNAGEAVAESFDPWRPDYLANPALIVGNVGEAFSAMSETDVVRNGKPAVKVALKPAEGMRQVTSASLYFSPSADPVPVAAEIELSDGSVLELSISSFSLSAMSGDSAFRFDPSGLTEDFVITDLR